MLIGSIWEEPDLTGPGIWPLCYSWIGYLQANGPPRALLSKSVDHGFTCSHRSNADNPNLEVITAPSGYCQIFTLLLAEILQVTADFCLITFTSWTDGCQGLAASAVRSTLDWQMTMWYLCHPVTDVICHHSPHKTRQFSCGCRHCHILLFPMPDKFIVPAS